MINHVKIHQIFNILKEDFIKAEIPEIPGIRQDFIIKILVSLKTLSAPPPEFGYFRVKIVFFGTYPQFYRMKFREISY